MNFAKHIVDSVTDEVMGILFSINLNLESIEKKLKIKNSIDGVPEMVDSIYKYMAELDSITTGLPNGPTLKRVNHCLDGRLDKVKGRLEILKGLYFLKLVEE
jgi:hypothetical protein